MSSKSELAPADEPTMRVADRPPLDPIIAQRRFDASGVMTDEFRSSVVASVFDALKIEPGSTITFHDVKRAANLAVSSALAKTRELIGPTDITEETTVSSPDEAKEGES